MKYPDIDKIMNQLSELGIGIHYCGKSLGWINIRKLRDGFYVTWTSIKSFNDHDGLSVVVVFHPDRIGWIYQTAITMWPIHDTEQRREIVIWMSHKIEKAHKIYEKRKV